MIALETDGFFSDGLEDTVIYNDGTGPASMSAVVDYWADREKMATIMVKKTDVPDPEYRHTFTIGDDVWYVRPPAKDKNYILAQDENFFLLAISKNERFSQWRT